MQEGGRKGDAWAVVAGALLSMISPEEVQGGGCEEGGGQVEVEGFCCTE